MVRPGARRGDDDTGLVTDRTGRVEGVTVTASSRGVRGRHSTSDIPSTSAPIGSGMYYDPGAPGSSTQSPPIPFRTHPPTTSHHLYTPVDSSYSSAEYGATARGNPSFDVGLGRDSGTSRSEKAVRVGSLRIHSGEDDEDECEDDSGHYDDDDGDGDGKDHVPVPVVEASSSGHRLASV
ncbi:hypothetical protein M9H77_04315 [Catharanthus roseus]|uniref:Uncharacterized protein n=1 Tax=Catharanthus roseus TaxID=4058 RepID=A0ACC0CDZ0_CATRO|nr:hypothetical protein M9H77_04315 [Catharanthus roseus]